MFIVEYQQVNTAWVDKTLDNYSNYGKVRRRFYFMLKCCLVKKLFGLKISSEKTKQMESSKGCIFS